MSGIQDLDKVRISNEGHAFHVVWTARRCLRLLDQQTQLQAVIVEGVSPSDDIITDEMAEGLLKVDTAEYYGGQSFTEATARRPNEISYRGRRLT